MTGRTWILFAIIGLGLTLSGEGPSAQPDGAARLDFSTYFGGSGEEVVTAVRVDPAGNIYLAGSTRSSDLPTTVTLVSAPADAGTLGFLIKLSASRSIVYSTYLERPVVALAVDAAGNAFVADNLPSGARFSGTFGDVVVTKINAAGSGVVYSVRLAGSGNDQVAAIAADPTGALVVTGQTSSRDFPLVNPLQTTVPPGSVPSTANAFITKLDADGRIVFSTGWGGNSDDAATSIAVDGSRDIVVAGVTQSTDFVTTPGAFQRTLASTGCSVNAVPCRDAFVIRLSPDGQTVRYSTLFGGTNGESVTALALDQFGSAHIAGATGSSDLPLRNALQASCDGSSMVNGCSPYVTKFSPDGSSLQYSTYFGSRSYYVGGLGQLVNGLSVDPSGNLVATGRTQGNDLPVIRALQTVNGSGPLFKSTDDGATWSPSGAGIVGTGVWYLTGVGRRSPLYAVPLGAAAHRSDDEGGTWRALGAPGYLVADPLTPSILYAIGANGLQKSTDGGATWSRILDETPYGSFGSLAVAPSSPSNIYAAVRRGIFHSPNGGVTWSLVLDTEARGSPALPYVQYLAVDPQNADAVYAMFSDRSVMRREAGQQWSAIASLDCPGNQLVFAAGLPSTMYARACGKVWKSLDRGGSWQVAGFEDRTAAWISVDPSTPNVIYIASAQNGVYRSRDYGKTWARIREPLEQDVRAILIDASAPGTIYVGATTALNAFVTKFDPSGAVILSTYMGGLNAAGAGVAIDRDGAIIIGGTSGQGLPVMQPLQRAYRGASDAFVARLLDRD